MSSGMHPKEKGSSACGCVVFSNDLKRVVLVESKRLNNFCPPKGGRQRGESTTIAALRELREESGILVNQIELIENCFVDEISKNGAVCVRYRVARLNSKEDAELTCDNPNEILQQGFYSLSVARSLLSAQRQMMLEETIQHAKRAFDNEQTQIKIDSIPM